MNSPQPADTSSHGEQNLPSGPKDPWEEIENLFVDTVQRAKNAFTFNLVTNVVIVAVGVCLVASSILYTWVKGVDVISAGIAGIGVADFVLVFFLGPQTYVEDAVENLARVQFVYRSWAFELAGASYYGSKKQATAGYNLQDLKGTVTLMEDLTSTAIRQLGMKAEKKEGQAGSGSTKGGSGESVPSPQSRGPAA